MKKLVFIIPLMAVSLLASCNNGGGGEQFTVTFDTVGGSYIESQKVLSGAKAIKPSDPTKEQTDYYTFDFKEWELNGVVYDFNTPITKDITLKATYDKNARHYIAGAINENNLTFTTTNGDPLENIDITAGQNFTFKVKANSQNYVVPSILNISVKEMEPLANGYRVESPGNAESKVTINGPKVIGDVVISGIAVDSDKFNYKASSLYGLIVEEGASGTGSKTDGLTLTFKSQRTGSTIPKAENIYIQFDNVPDVEGGIAWISPADVGVSDEYCSYDENSGKLTIKANHILNSIDIKARANNYELLNELAWGKINELSTTGSAPYVFYLGEEKMVTVNNQPHQVRIIDFNEDADPDGNNLGITFEFANYISDKNGYSLASLWQDTDTEEGSNYNYLDSTIRKNLTGNGNGRIMWYEKGNGKISDDYDTPVYDMLPNDLKGVLKTTRKKVNVYIIDGWIETDVDDKLFLLSANEMNRDTPLVEGGEAYEYYKNTTSSSDDPLRIKQQVKGLDGALTSFTNVTESAYGSGFSYAGYNSSYEGKGGTSWLRSPRTDIDSFAYACEVSGRVDGSYFVYQTAYAVAPAFCI